MTEELDNTILKSLAEIGEAYLRDEDGNLIPTTILTNTKTGEVIAKWPRSSKTASEVEAIVRQANELDALPVRTPGRPPVGPAIIVRLAPSMIARLDAIATETDESRAAVIRRLLGTALR